MTAAQILLVEDNPSDVRLIREAMKESKIASQLHVVTDGDDALDFLHRIGRHQHAPRPDLIVLDLNLPRRSGHDVLAEIKRAPELRAIPIVVLSTSADEDDVRRSYDLHANCYITKPADLDRFIAVVRRLDEFWLDVVSLPSRSG